MGTTVALNLLFVEDNRADARLLTEYIASGVLRDSTVAHERTMAAGLDRLSGGDIDAVLLDLGLPDSSGLDTFRRFAEARGTSAIVVVSGLDDTRLAEEAVALGAQDYLVKDDATPLALGRAVMYAVRRQRVLDDLDRARQAQLAAKDHFLSHVSHELRTPLTAVHQYVSLVADGLAGPLSEDQDECLEVAMRNVSQLMVMIEDLLTVGRVQSGTLPIVSRPMQVSDLIDECVSSFGLTAKRKGISLGTDASGLPDAVGDPWRTREIINNLLSNAVRFTPPDGSITVYGSSDGEQVLVSVRDSGPGVPPEHREHVFEEFFQVASDDDSGRAGLGLGLFLCRQLAERQGGRIWNDRAPDGGAEFSFTIPLSAEPNPGAQ